MPPKLRPIKKKIELTSKPPQHTFENDHNHRSFLSRSLAKSDMELNAIIKLNSSLKDLKEYIVQHFGMNVLLDIGEGIISLSSSHDDSAAGDTTAGGSDGDNTDKDGKKVDNEYEEVERLVFKEKGFPLMQKNGQNVVTSGNASTTPSASDGNEVKASSSPVDGDKDDKDNKLGETGVKTEMEEEAKDALNTTAPALDSEQRNNNNDKTDNQPQQQEQKQNQSERKNQNSYYSKLQNDPTFNPIIKNFILRLKLRRKLLNRLARRLLRLNHAMDGKLHKINPPMLPKYGTSFEKHITVDIKNRVNVWNKDFECREEVLEKLWMKKEELAKAIVVKKKESDLEDMKKQQELLKELNDRVEGKQEAGGEEKERQNDENETNCQRWCQIIHCTK